MFHFKHFSLYHENSALKISTDAVLLVASTPVNGVQTLLDIGCGCGVIAFCLAWKMRQKVLRSGAAKENAANEDTLQKNALQSNPLRENLWQENACGEKHFQEIIGIDIDGPSVEEALLNLELFPKSQEQNISFLQQSIQDFARQARQRFDLIVSNPPFFVDSLKPSTAKKNISKHNDSLSFEDLRDAVRRLLAPQGRFYLILPAKESEMFEQISNDQLFKFHQLFIQPTFSKPVNRIITGYTLMPDKSCSIEKLCLRNADGSLSDDYRRLTKDFLIG